ncbi:putative bicyclomycin resistance protein [Aspergillus ellipticus CBS 707.79]|uniref:Putative bicyclomycin resistance protein n=1 Tax=Aspergillus ellipticus CBS 707.79 TaxID=1448320 RepID=A0A319E912_9EURO|nr:putative bicyclomycin resistance protein [Aspergillus ellipticus CBS 707.79]
MSDTENIVPIEEVCNVDRKIVTFEGPADPANPLAWKPRKKLGVSLALAFSTFTVGFNSSLFSSATTEITKEFQVSHVTSTLGVSLYVIGFATGPIFWAPLSELSGRRIPLLLGVLGFSVFSLGVASATNIQTVMLCRFWSGIFAASPMTVAAAVFADLFDGLSRGPATSIFCVNVLMGPMLAPSVGGFICASSLGWRWTAWLGSLMGFTALILDILFLAETDAPGILTKKASSLRHETGDWSIHSDHEEINVDARQLVIVYLARPLRLLLTEPPVLLITLFLAFIYGLMYLFLTAYPIVFGGVHGFTPGLSGLAYLGLVLVILCGAAYVISTQPSYHRKLDANHGIIVPEWRLPPAIAGSVNFAAGLFWFGWSGYKSRILCMVPVLSGIPTGFGLFCIFQQLLNYLIDIYLPYSASVNAGSSLIRSLCGFGFPLFAQSLFDSLGINWAATLLGGIAVLCIPLPWTFFIWGPKLQTKTKFGVDSR